MKSLIRSKKLKIVASLCLALMATGALGACQHRHNPEKFAERMTSKITSKLDLNDSQKAKLDEVKVAFLKSRSENKPDREKARAEIKSLITAEKLDTKRIKSLIEERRSGMEKNMDSVLAKVAEFHATLTAEQKQKAVEMMDKFSRKMNHD